MFNLRSRTPQLALLLALLLALVAMPVLAQDPTPSDDEVNRIAKQLYCPVCENNMLLDVCPTEACRQWRELIRTMLAEGKSEAEIKQHFVTQYGTRVLNEQQANSLLAQDPTPSDDEVNRIAKQLYCPVCESTPLDVCPTEACRQWREVIRTMLSEGKSEAEIKQHFVTQYGARVLNEPPNRLVAYLVPGVAILLGALMLFRGFQMWLKPVAVEAGPGESEAEPVPQDEYIRKLEEELKKRK